MQGYLKKTMSRWLLFFLMLNSSSLKAEEVIRYTPSVAEWIRLVCAQEVANYQFTLKGPQVTIHASGNSITTAVLYQKGDSLKDVQELEDISRKCIDEHLQVTGAKGKVRTMFGKMLVGKK